MSAAAVRFSFSGGSAASITDLTVPNGAAANVTSTLSGAQATAPGAAVTETLTLHNVGDVDATRAAVERALGDPELRRRIGAAARERVREYCSWDRVTERTLQVYAEAA